MSTAERIITKRKELGFTQTELANRAGLKPPAICQYESGSRNPSYEALIKLSNALNVTTDYLISGNEISSDIINDTTSKFLLKIVNNLSIKEKDKLLEYAIFLSNGYFDNTVPIFNRAIDYTDYIFKKINVNTLPIDVYKIAHLLNIVIIKEPIESDFEGLLINGKEKIIILDENITNEQRKKFTIATLIGHAIIPWHVKAQYKIREKGTSTLLTEDIQDIESLSFAANLIMPKVHFVKDFIKNKISLEELKELAYKKYDVSLSALLNRLVEYNKNKYTVVFSKNRTITSAYSGNRPLVKQIHIDSNAATFFDTPSIVEETRSGSISASYWFSDANSDELVYEQSIYNPRLGSVLTFLTIEENI